MIFCYTPLRFAEIHNVPFRINTPLLRFCSSKLTGTNAAIISAKIHHIFIKTRFMQCERHFFEKTQNDLFNFQNDFPIFYGCPLFQVEQEFGHSLNLRECDFLNT